MDQRVGMFRGSKTVKFAPVESEERSGKGGEDSASNVLSCPNGSAARKLLRRVLDSSGAETQIEEVDTSAPETPEPLHGWGSPTILIDGADLEGQVRPGSACCRLYRDSSGHLQGIPTEAALRSAIERTFGSCNERSAERSGLSVCYRRCGAPRPILVT